MDKRIPKQSWVRDAFRLWLRLPNYVGRKQKYDMVRAYELLNGGKTYSEIAAILNADFTALCHTFERYEIVRKKITANNTANTVSGA